MSFATLEPILSPAISLLHAETLDSALQLLGKRKDIELVLTTVDFDDSRMFDLLRRVKELHPEIPVIVCRASDTALTDIALEGVRIASNALGAAAFIDLPALEQQYGRDALLEPMLPLILKHVPAV